jgi:hypothetical protein
MMTDIAISTVDLLLLSRVDVVYLVNQRSIYVSILNFGTNGNTTMTASQDLFHFLMVVFVAAVFAEYEIISRVGENATLEAGCDENLVAWENNTEPFYAMLVESMTFYNVEINGTFQNITLSRDALRVLADSMPIFPL